MTKDMEEKYSVYKHTSPNGKVYIGITKRSLNDRWRNGNGYKKNPHFWKAIEKYGWDKIKHEIIASDLSFSEAEYYERYFISLYQSFNPNYGYNMTFGGDHGLKITDEVRNRISKKLKDYFSNHPEAKEEMAKRMIGTTLSEETKKKMSETHKANMTEERRKRIGDAHRGIKLTSHKRKPRSQESNKKISEAKKGKHFGGKGAIPKKIICVETGVVYNGVSEICELFGYKYQNIYLSCSKGTKSHGYTWQYANEYTSGKM